MLKKYSILTLFLWSLCLVANAQFIYIPDANFKNALVNTLCVDTNNNGTPDADADTNNDGEIQESEALAVLSLIVRERSIQSLEGIEKFLQLEYLDCALNQLTALDLQGLTNLQRFDCSNNQLTTLNIQGLTNLTGLSCGSNQLTTLDLQGLTNLKYLYCYSNQLTTLDVQGLTNLDFLNCDNNQLTTLDVHGLTNLITLYCNSNQLTTLDVALTYLYDLYCQNNQLTSLDLQGLTYLRYLYCENNQLMTLDVQGLTNLDYLYCQNNQLTTLYVKNGSIEELFFENNPLVYICCDEGQLSSVQDQATQNGLTNCVINNACYQIHVQGQFTQDLNLNCQTDFTETGLAGRVIKAKKTGIEPFYAITNDSGYYDFDFEPGTYRLSVLPYNSYYALCDDVVWVNLPLLGDTMNVDFLVKPVIPCPLLEVNISSSDIRHCTENQYIVRYCNTGPAPAPNAQVTVTLSDNVQFISSTIPGVNIGGQAWQFSLGEVGSEACGSFAINFLAICDLTEVGQSICATAHITPDNICTLPNSTWSGAEVMVNGYCEGDSVRLVIRNIGMGNMTANQKFRIIEDHVICKEGLFNLPAQDSMIIKMPANGSTYRLESAQEPSFPFFSRPSVTVEGCGLNSDGSFSLGFVSQFNTEDANPFYSQDCREISIISFDLNAKSAQPTGVGDAHYIEPKTPIDYQIRFQNTGNDTVSTVVIRETLSAWLDPESFKLGISDHAFRVDFEGHNILKFTFDNILLPNSNVNEAASRGFVQFRITPKILTPLGTEIENQTAIFFDLNAPVTTNMVFHTVDTGFLDRKIVSVFSEITTTQQQIYPNPIRAGDLLFFENLPAGNSRISLVDQLGKVVFEAQLVGDTIRIPSGLASGVYFLAWTGENGVKRWGKVVVR